MIPRRTITLYPGIARDIARFLARQARGLRDPDAVARFESAFATRIGTRHAVATSSGTDAMLLILDALGVGPGDHVLAAAYTIRPLFDALRARGCDVEPVDVSVEDFNIDVADLARRLRPDTRVVIVTHMFGVPARMDAIGDALAGSGAVLIEDAAHAHGATFGGRACGSLGRAAFFSLDQVKPVSTFGGGVATTDDDHLADHMRAALAKHPEPCLRLRKIVLGFVEHVLINSPLFRIIVWATRRESVRAAIGAAYRRLDTRPPVRNPRLNALQAAIGLAQLGHLNARIAARRRVAEAIAGAASGLRFPDIPPGATASHHKLCALARGDTPAVREHFYRRGIDVGILDDINQPCHRDLGFAPKRFPGTETVYRRLVELPAYETLGARRLARVTAAVAEVE